LLLLAIWLWLSHKPEELRPRVRGTRWIEIDPGSGVGRARNGRKRAKHARAARPPLSKLGALSGLFGPKSSGAPETSREAPAPTIESEIARPKLVPFVRALRERIDEGLVYPVELADARREGTVDVDFLVDREGKLLVITEVLAEDRFLKVLVLRTLRKKLCAPLHTGLTDSDRLRVKAHFRFALYYPDAERIERVSALSSLAATIHFFRAYNTGRMESGGTSLGTNADTQSFVLNAGPFSVTESPRARSGAVGLDVITILKSLFDKPKAAIDPLDRYREDPDF
jgi:hypothetical protein